MKIIRKPRPQRAASTPNLACLRASWTDFLVDGTHQTGLCFFDLDEAGLIERITDFWPVPYEPPPGREHLTERYDPTPQGQTP
jgi:hypothetical protein